MAIRNFDEDTLTAEVLRRIEGTPDARLKQVMTSLIRHLHGFVREVRPTQAEWLAGIRFLAETGHWCDDQRNEYILFSDTHGVSMLVDFINYGADGKSTESTVLGPFYVEGAPEMSLGANIGRPGTPGEPCRVTGRVVGADGKPLAGAVIDVWEAAGDGFYDVQRDEGANLRARFRTGADGRYDFRCVLPVSYAVPNDGPVGKLLVATGRHPMRPGHLHFMIQAPGHATLVTHLFTQGDQYLDSDAVFGVKESLIVEYRKSAAGGYEASFDFVLKAEKRARRAA
jgi:protocatechuate 3,4-dioxygenase beta subunit